MDSKGVGSVVTEKTGTTRELQQALAAAVDDSPDRAKRLSQEPAAVNRQDALACSDTAVPKQSFEELVKSSQDEIDDLFNDFDAALTAVTDKVGTNTETIRANGTNVTSTASVKIGSARVDAP